MASDQFRHIKLGESLHDHDADVFRQQDRDRRNKGAAQIRAKIHPKLVPKAAGFLGFGTLIAERVLGQMNCRNSCSDNQAAERSKNARFRVSSIIHTA